MVIKGFNITCGEDIEDSRKLIYSNNPSPSRTKFPKTYIFDEDKSVRWNREEVERLNAEVDASVKKYREDILQSEQNLRNEVIDYIVDYFRVGESRIGKFDRGAAEAIWAKVQSIHDDSDYLYLDEYLDLIDTVMTFVKG